MRILWSSNAMLANTGYGVQAKSILPRLNALGHECAQFAWYGMQGGIMEANGIRIYPAYADPFGNDVIGAHVKHWNADLVITLMDIWVLADDFAQRCRPAKFAPWFPVDHSPIPARVCQLAQGADYPLTYSKFGYDEAQKAGIDKLGYIPHGVEVNTFKPGDKAAARRELAVPEGAYLVSMVAANKGFPPRKAFPEQLQAFAHFQRRHPEALLYLHTVRNGAHGGVDFDHLTAACGIPQESVRYVDQYLNAIGLPPEYLASVYQASDCLLAASTSEGFGIPIIEAQACGCPVITTDCTSMPELTVNGIATEPAQPQWSAQESWVATPSVANIEAALETIHGWDYWQRAEHAVDGIRHIRANYDWDVLVRDWWSPFLQRVEADIRQEREGTPAQEARTNLYTSSLVEG